MMREFIVKKENLLIGLFIFSILLIFFNSILFRDNIYLPGDFLRSDTSHQNLPFKFLLDQSLQVNRIPLWITDIFAGFPLAAEGQSGVFYPLHWLFFKILPFIKAYNWLLFTNFVLLSLGTWLFCRELKIGKYGAAFAATILPLSSFFILHITHQNILASASWLPLIYFFNQRFFKQRNTYYFLASALTIAFSILAGSLQMVFYGVFSLLIYLLLFSRYFSWQKSKIVVIFVLEIALALLVSAIQILPTLELLKISQRSLGLGNITLDSLPYHWRNLITFFIPYAFGDPGRGTYPHFGGSWGMFWENTGYIGLIPLGLVLLTLRFISKIRRIKYLWLLVLIFLLLCLGKYSPLFWIYYLPPFNYFRVTARFLLPVLFYLTILAGWGFQSLLRSLQDRFNRRIIGGLLVLLTLFDLFVFGYNYNPSVDVSAVLKLPQTAEYLNSIGRKGRIISLGATQKYDEINKNGWRDNPQILFQNNALDPDINMLWGIPSIEGYSGLSLQNNTLLLNAVYSDIYFQPDGSVINVSEESLKTLGISAVEYVVTPFKLEGKLSLVYSTLDNHLTYYIYQNPYYISRGFLIPDSQANIFFLDPKRLKMQKNTRLIKDDPEEVVFEITTEIAQTFILQDMFYPGWQAYVNGQKVEIQPKEKIFRAVAVPAGQSEVKFIYRPQSFIWGRNISLAGLGVILILAIYSGFQGNRIFSQSDKSIV